MQVTDPHADPHDREADCGHFKSAGDPHPLCDICSKASTGRFCTTTDTCDLCKDLDKAIWRRITDTRRRRDNRMRQQNLTYGEMTATPVTDPSDSGFQGDPPFSRPETSTSRPDMAVIAAPSSSPARPQDDVQYSDVSSPDRSHASRVSIVDDTDVEDQESGEISEDSLEESKRSLTQFSPKREVMVDPSEIEIPELYQWIADHSSFSVAPPYSTSKQSPIFFECQRRPPKVEPSFLSLSSSPAIVRLANQRSNEARELDLSSRVTLGKLPPPRVCKISKKKYQLADDCISITPLTWPIDTPSFISKVEPQSRMYVMDKDLVTLEGQARGALSVLSNLDALVTAAQNALQDMQVRDPFFTRSLLEIGGGVADLSKVSMAQLHQIVTLRRDSALWKRTAPSLAPKLVMDLRHAPFLGETSVFSKPLLDSVVDQRHADQKKSLLEKAATSQASFLSC